MIRKRISIILIALMLFSSLAITAGASLVPEGPDIGFKFKEIIWDGGWIWLIMMVMGLALMFDIIRKIIADARGEKEEREEGKAKPAYEIIVRRRIE